MNQQRSGQNFFKGRSPNGEKTHEKKNTHHPGHKVKANQNHTKSPPHSC
jgi:hypothetical protein